jgi:hypothetical protein
MRGGGCRPPTLAAIEVGPVRREFVASDVEAPAKQGEEANAWRGWKGKPESFERQTGGSIPACWVEPQYGRC